MKVSRLPKFIIISMLGVGMLLSATQAEAGNWRHRHKHKHKQKHKYYNDYFYHGPFGKIVFNLPWDFITIVVGGKKYKYHDGRYYKKHPYGWKHVRAPRGACITRLPRGYKKVVIGKQRYFAHDGVYYKSVSDGYEVVADPTPNYSVVKKVKVFADYDHDFESYTINIPVKKGGYESIELTRDGDGFVGPQGEYYESFPRVAQLKIFYGL